MRTTVWTVGLGATLLLIDSRRASAQDALFTSERELHDRRSISVRACHARRRARSRLLTLACERTIGWLRDDPVEGLLDRPGMRKRHSRILPARHVRRHIQLSETAFAATKPDVQFKAQSPFASRSGEEIFAKYGPVTLKTQAS